MRCPLCQLPPSPNGAPIQLGKDERPWGAAPCASGGDCRAAGRDWRDFLLECSMCGWLLPPSHFAFRSVKRLTLNDHCRKCHSTYRREHYLRNRARYFIQAYAQTRRKRDDTLQRVREHLLRHPCVDCGEADIATLDFDHVDPSTKLTAVATMVGHRNWRGSKKRSRNAWCAARTVTVDEPSANGRSRSPLLYNLWRRGSSSVGRAPDSQFGCRGFETRLPLHPS